ncbi:hypothetical protein QR680_009066 [Steinernema hermaphroditum]|uniref:Uncharacterized protein n=1 Tax=Steinernema hermaphroditum TaxID=289476 RepID=A0AA39M978_9BILA|nr:hypothetical protein QR680_009066 [Steinernema hermaphroditum]
MDAIGCQSQRRYPLLGLSDLEACKKENYSGVRKRCYGAAWQRFRRFAPHLNSALWAEECGDDVMKHPSRNWLLWT